MKKFLDKGLVPIKNEAYLGLVIMLAPLLNFLNGINIDLYTPSLPAISQYFVASMSAVKNTITVTMIGFALGCLFFGALMDALGRRRVILLGLTFYIIASFLALACRSIEQLMIIRFIQGVMVATASIGSRALITDNFTGHRFIIGLLYTSIAYGLGPIIAPFIGGILQYHFGWRANFFAYGLIAIGLMIVFALYINESIAVRRPFSLKGILSDYVAVMQHGAFMVGVLIIGITQIEMMVYPTVGSFLVENILHRTAISFGNSALVISCGYLLGTLTNRAFIKRLHLHHLTDFGFALLILSIITQIFFSFFGKLNLFSLILPIFIINFANGFIFPNILGRCLKLFPTNVGIATAVLSCSVMTIAAIGIFIISHISVNGLMNLLAIFAVAAIIELLLFYIIFKPVMKTIP
jgi:MFS family permease